MDFKIDLFEDRVDGWHLQVADRCINGWLGPSEEQYIKGVNLNGDPTAHLPDSGWAVLQIVLNYFELFAAFNGLTVYDKKGNKRSGETFKAGLKEVFRAVISKPIIGDILVAVRNGLYHTGVTEERITLTHTIHVPFKFNEHEKRLYLNPHRFVPEIRNNFRDYIERLRDPKNLDLRQKFEDEFNKRYKK